MSSTEPTPSPQPAMSDTQLTLIVYILYFAAYITGITGLIGVIIAHVKIGDADPLTRAHYQFQIRTFWIGQSDQAEPCIPHRRQTTPHQSLPRKAPLATG